MASNYGLNFGFRRSDENARVSEGRFRTPVAGTFRFGSLVMIDAAAPGFLKAATSGAIGEGATVGLLLQEEIWQGSIYGQAVAMYDSFNLGSAKNNHQSVITSGAGTKIWLQNTASQTRADGRVIAAVTMVDLTTGTPAVMDYLTWDGAKFAKGTGATDSMLRITEINVSAGYCEAVLIR